MSDETNDVTMVEAPIGVKDLANNRASLKSRKSFVASKKTNKETEYRGLSLVCNFDLDSDFRQKCIALIEHPYFERIILATIFATCFVLAFEVSWANSQIGASKTWFLFFEYVSQTIFTFEFFVKIVAEGFLFNGKGSYLSDPWNRLDFVVVVFGFSAFIPADEIQVPWVRAVRALRVLRPLRAVTMFPDLQLLVVSMLQAFSMMSDVLFLTLTFLFLFGIAGVQLFGGAFRNNCYQQVDYSSNLTVTNPEDGLEYLQNTSRAYLCGGSDPAFQCYGTERCLPLGENPVFGIIGFDNVAQAWLNIFTSMTLEGWADVSYYSFESVSYLAGVYFLLVVLVLAFFISQLITSVVFTSYTAAVKDEQEKAYQRELTNKLLNDTTADAEANIHIKGCRGLKVPQSQDSFIGSFFAPKISEQLNPYCKVVSISYRGNSIQTHITEPSVDTADPSFVEPPFPIYLADKVACVDLQVFNYDRDTADHHMLGQVRVPVLLENTRISGWIALEEPNDHDGFLGINKHIKKVQNVAEDIGGEVVGAAKSAAADVVKGASGGKYSLSVTTDEDKQNNSKQGGDYGCIEIELTYGHTSKEQRSLLKVEHQKERDARIAASKAEAEAKAREFKKQKRLSHVISRAVKSKEQEEKLGIQSAIVVINETTEPMDLTKAPTDNVSKKSKLNVVKLNDAKTDLPPVLADENDDTSTTTGAETKVQVRERSHSTGTVQKKNSIISLTRFADRLAQADSARQSPTLRTFEGVFGDDDEENVYEVIEIQLSKGAKFFYDIVTQKWFDYFSIFIIVLNTLALASEHFGQSDSWTDFLSVANIVFTIYFTLELFCKLFAFDWMSFKEDYFNLFDIFVVGIAIIELIAINVADYDGSGLSVLRSFRLLRVFKLATNWETLRRVLLVIVDAMSSLFYFSVLLVLYHFIIGLIGVQLFKGRMLEDLDDPDSTARFNYEHLGWAVVTTFQIIGGENWNEVMYIAILNNGWVAAGYFLFVFISGNFIVLNLFLAILIEKYNSEDGNEELEKEADKDASAEETRRIKLMHMLEHKDGGAPVEDAVSPIEQQEAGDKDKDKQEVLVDSNDEKKMILLRSGDNSPLVQSRRSSHKSQTTTTVENTLPGMIQNDDDDDVDAAAAAAVEETPAQEDENPLPPPPAEPEAALPGAVVIADETQDKSDHPMCENCESYVAVQTCEQCTTVKHFCVDCADAHTSKPENSAHLMTPYYSATAAARQSPATRGDSSGSATDASFEEKKKKKESAFGISLVNPLALKVDAFENLPNPFKKENYRTIHMEGQSLFCLAPDNGFRVLFRDIVQHKVFETSVLLAILVTMILLAMDTPYEGPIDQYHENINMLNVICSVLFIVEAVCKIIAMGFLVGWDKKPDTSVPADKRKPVQKPGYIWDPWNRLDFVIVVISLVDFIPGLSLDSLKALRAARSLRPLKLINRFDSLKIVISAMLRSIPGILHVLMVSSLFFVIFATLGVSIFGGQFYWCVETATGEIMDLNQAKCWEAERLSPFKGSYSWENPDFGSFDNVFAALLLLFEVSSMEMWPDVLYRAADINGVGNRPVRDNHQMLSLYFVAFMIVTSFFLIQLISGVVVDNFQAVFAELKEQKEKEREYNRQKSEHEKRLADEAYAKEHPNSPKRPSVAASPLIGAIKRLSISVNGSRNNSKTESATTTTTAPLPPPSDPDDAQAASNEGKADASTTVGADGKKHIIKKVAGLDAYERPENGCRAWVFDRVNTLGFEKSITVVIFFNVMSMAFYSVDNPEWDSSLDMINNICMVIYIVEVLAKVIALGTAYFHSLWNLVDLVVIGVGVIPMISPDDSSRAVLLLRTARIVRVLRIFESYRVFKAFDRLIDTLKRTLPALMAVGFLLFLLNFVYSCIGMALFSFVPEGDFININVNFNDFGIAMFTMFRAATGESWNGIMHDCQPRKGCTAEDSSNCGTWLAVPFWVSFVILSQWLVVQLIIAVVLSQYEQLMEEDDEARAEAIKALVELPLPQLLNREDMIRRESMSINASPKPEAKKQLTNPSLLAPIAENEAEDEIEMTSTDN